MKREKILLGVVLAIALFISGAFELNAQEIKKNIEIGKAKSVRTNLVFPAGKLVITPDGKSMCEGIYRYSRDNWKPDITYSEDSETGYLRIETEDNRIERKYNDEDQNKWIIAFNRDVKNEMKIDMIAGESDINLQGCDLERFDFEMVAGSATINLRNTSVPFLEMKAVAGEAELDLSGKWKNDLDAEIKGGVGELTVILPSDIGIKLNISGGLGEVKADGFRRQNRTYTNDLYGESKYSLYLDITGGIGSVNVRTVN